MLWAWARGPLGVIDSGLPEWAGGRWTADGGGRRLYPYLYRFDLDRQWTAESGTADGGWMDGKWELVWEVGVGVGVGCRW